MSIRSNSNRDTSMNSTAYGNAMYGSSAVNDMNLLFKTLPVESESVRSAVLFP